MMLFEPPPRIATPGPPLGQTWPSRERADEVSRHDVPVGGPGGADDQDAAAQVPADDVALRRVGVLVGECADAVVVAADAHAAELVGHQPGRCGIDADVVAGDDDVALDVHALAAVAGDYVALVGIADAIAVCSHAVGRTRADSDASVVADR